MPKVYTGDLTKMFDISGKKAMIFGGAGGFGEAIAAGYAANGCSVCISSRSEEKLQAAKAKIEAAAAPGVKVMYIAGDAGDEEFVKKAVEVVTGPEGLGGCDILVNAQGINKKMWSWEIDTDFFEKMLHTNITSLMLTCKYFGNWMKSNNVEGAIALVGVALTMSRVLRRSARLISSMASATPTRAMARSSTSVPSVASVLLQTVVTATFPTTPPRVLLRC